MVNLMKQHRLKKMKSFNNLVKNTGKGMLVTEHLVKMHIQRQVKQNAEKGSLVRKSI